MPLPFIETLGQQTLGNAVGAGMGLLLQGANNRQQIKQQQKLTDMQLAAQKQMGIFNREQQMQLWNDTNYSAQKEQMKKAGLSPGLMYGTSGAGATTASATPGNVSAPQARQSNESLGMGLQMGQAAMMQAQVKLMEAQARNLDADTLNKPTVGKNIETSTGKLGAEIQEINAKVQNILQDTKNKIAAEQLTNVQAENTKTQTEYIGKDFQQRQTMINKQIENIDQTIKNLKTQNKIDNIEADNRQGLLRADLAVKIADAYLKEAQKAGVEQSIQESIRKVINMVQENMREWDKLSNDSQRRIQEITEYMDQDNGIPRDIKELLDRIIIIPGIGSKTPTPITGFHKR